MAHELIDTGASRSFHEPHPLLAATAARGDIVLIIGAGAADAFRSLGCHERYAAVLIELGTECLGAHTGEARGEEGSNVLGFARFRLGRRRLRISSNWCASRAQRKTRSRRRVSCSRNMD